MIGVVQVWQNELRWGFCVFLSCFYSCPGELFCVWGIVILQLESSYTDLIFYFLFLMWSRWEQLVSEYKKAPALNDDREKFFMGSGSKRQATNGYSLQRLSTESIRGAALPNNCICFC